MRGFFAVGAIRPGLRVIGAGSRAVGALYGLRGAWRAPLGEATGEGPFCMMGPAKSEELESYSESMSEESDPKKLAGRRGSPEVYSNRDFIYIPLSMTSGQYLAKNKLLSKFNLESWLLYCKAKLTSLMC